MVVSDWMMPEMNGLELCEKIRNAKIERYVYFILVTGQDAQQDIVHGLEAGADDYITKPVNLEELRARIDIGARIVQQERELSRRYKAIRENYFQTIRMFANLIEVFNEELGGHCRRVAKLALRLAKRIPGFPEKDLPVLEATGLLHDIGRVGFPTESISKKVTEMNGDERDFYRSHPIQGEVILKEIEFLQPIAKLVRAHHEQFNGRGFPDGLNSKEIPLLVKIISAVDTYDVLVHRWKIPLEEVPDHLQQQKGYQLDPFLVDHLLEINLENIQEMGARDFLEVVLDDLREGMMLLKNVRTKSGALMMPADTELDSYGIEKLKKYFDLKRITNKLYIHKPLEGC